MQCIGRAAVSGEGENVQDRKLAPKVYRAIELVQATLNVENAPRSNNIHDWQLRLGSRTAGGGSMVLDSSTLAVELVVNDPRGLSLGAVEAALGSRADRCGTLAQAGNVAGEHCGG